MPRFGVEDGSTASVWGEAIGMSPGSIAKRRPVRPVGRGSEGVELYGFVALEGGSGGSGYSPDAAVREKWRQEHGAVQLPVPMTRRIPP